MELKRDSSVFQLFDIFYLKGAIHWFVHVSGFFAKSSEKSVKTVCDSSCFLSSVALEEEKTEKDSNCC